MPRERNLSGRALLSADQTAPLVDARGFEASVESMVVWANSATLRSALMAAIDFPLPDDLPAFLLLNQLIYRGAGRASEMAEAIQTSTSNITKIVRRLEQAGLVTRAPDPTDDRAVTIALTQTGRAAGERILAELRALYAAAFRDWTPSERRTFEQAAIRFARDLDVASGRAVSAISGVSWDEDPVAGNA